MLDILGDGSCIAFWKFEDSYADESGNYNGTPNGSVSFSENGKHGKCMQCATGNDWLSVGSSNSFQFGASDFSFTMWVNFNSIHGGEDGLVSKYNGYAGSFTLELIGGSRLGGYSDSSTECRFSNAGTFVPTIGTWYHIAFIAKQNDYHAYVDGVRLPNTHTSNFNVTNNLQCVLGNCKASNPTEKGLKGRMDTVRAFNKALSSAEVLTVFREGTLAKKRLHIPTPVVLSTMPTALTRGFR